MIKITTIDSQEDFVAEMSNIQGIVVDDINSQLGNMLASKVFVASPRQCRFLQYIVDQTITGNIDHLKGYTIGIDVFDREPSFDPGIDSIVRVEAGRLRSKLREYYLTEGINDAIVIELPKGNYTPVFRQRNFAEIDPGDIKVKNHFPKNSIAVLPLRSLSDDVEQEYFSEGMTDAILTALASKKSLKVISLTSVMRFKNTDKPLKQIAEELNVSHILEGTVLKDGNTVRITAQLIESTTDFHIWGESFERKLKGVLNLQQEIADLIAGHLTHEIDHEDISEFRDKLIDPEAYEAYLLGCRARAKFTKEAFYEAARHFNQAIDLEPEYAAAYSGMASCYCGLGSHGFELEEPKKSLPNGLDFAERAIKLDDSLADPYTYKGIIKLKYEWDWTGAEACFEKALSISPNNAQAHMQYSMYFESLANFDRAIHEAEQAYHVDPLSKETNMNLAWQYYQADKLSEARAQLDHLLKIEPDFWGAYWDMAHIHLMEEEYDQAISAFRKSDAAKNGYYMPLQGLGYAYAKSGRQTEALAVIKKLNDFQYENYVSPYCYASIYMGLNDIEQVFDFLEQACQLRTRSLAWLNVAKEYFPVREDQRFKNLVNRIGIPA